MGLDSVELVMEVEKEFDIEISDAEAESITTVGALHFFVMYTLRQSGRVADTDSVFERLRVLICKQLGVNPSRVTPETNFVRDLHIYGR